MKTLFYILSCCIGVLWSEAAKCQTAAADNKVQESITFHKMPNGPEVYGIFEGRTPCREISEQLGDHKPSDCERLKWQLTLYKDPATQNPTTYLLETGLFNRSPMKGKWRITRGTRAHPSAIIYVLEAARPGKQLYLFKGDENVLFILDEKQDFQTGDQHLSYTLNRVKKVLRPVPER